MARKILLITLICLGGLLAQAQNVIDPVTGTFRKVYKVQENSLTDLETVQLVQTTDKKVVADKNAPTNTCDDQKAKQLDGISETETQAYPWLSADGLRLYYVNGVSGQDVFYLATRKDLNSAFGEGMPVSMQNSTNALGCWLSRDELNIYYIDRLTEKVLHHANRKTTDDAFSDFETINLTGEFDNFISGPSLTEDLSELYIYNDPGQKSIIVFHKQGDGSYALSGKINMSVGFIASPGQLSKNGLSYYVGADAEEGKSRQLVRFTRAKIGDNFSNPVFLDDINNMAVNNMQPSTNGDESNIVFVRNNGDSWSGDHLYIGHLAITQTIAAVKAPAVEPTVNKANTEVKTPNTTEIKREIKTPANEAAQSHVFLVPATDFTVKLYPNPTTEICHIAYSLPNDGQVFTLTLFSMEGKMIYTGALAASSGNIDLNTSGFKAGAYFCRITGSGGFANNQKMIVSN